MPHSIRLHQIETPYYWRAACGPLESARVIGSQLDIHLRSERTAQTGGTRVLTLAQGGPHIAVPYGTPGRLKFGKPGMV